jgi:hypothetical protein
LMHVLFWPKYVSKSVTTRFPGKIEMSRNQASEKRSQSR